MLLSISVGVAVLLPALTATAANVGLSVDVGQPGFYGRIDIGQVPPPVIYAQPLVIAPAPVAVMQRPIYLRVPPSHAKNWSRHCARYSACGQQTYFVREDWYRNAYAPARQVAYRDEQHRGGYAPSYRPAGPRDMERGHGHGRGHGKDSGKGRRD